jgi:hypothetical protein
MGSQRCLFAEHVRAVGNGVDEEVGRRSSHHDHDHEHGEDHHDSVPLGETAMNGLKIVATQHETPKPGGEAAFDVTVTGGGKPKAVRFWVGTEDAKGSVKAKAEAEAGNAMRDPHANPYNEESPLRCRPRRQLVALL